MKERENLAGGEMMAKSSSEAWRIRSRFFFKALSCITMPIGRSIGTNVRSANKLLLISRPQLTNELSSTDDDLHGRQPLVETAANGWR